MKKYWSPAAGLAAMVFVSILHAQGVYIPTASGEEFHSPGGNPNETYVPIPDMNLSVNPLQHSLEKETTPQASQTRADAVAPARAHDITSDVEFGFLRFKGTGFEMKGSQLALKTQYTRFMDNYTRAGARLYFEHTFGDDFNPSSSFGSYPGNNLTTIAFAKRDLFLNQEAGIHLNYSLFFDAHTAPQHAFNPQAYYAYKTTIGPAFVFGGGFIGYSITKKSQVKSAFSYSLLAGGGMTVGESFAANLDAFISHNFLVLGTEVPVYVSEFFVLTPGIKWPILFNYPKYLNLKLSLGAHARL